MQFRGGGDGGEAQGGDGMRMVQELQTMQNPHVPESKVLAASFKSPRQALDCLLAGCEAITSPVDVAKQMLNIHGHWIRRGEKFEQDWQSTFGSLSL